MERVFDYIGDVKPRGAVQTAEMLFYDDMLALQGSGYYDTYDDDWENDDDDDWGDSWDETM